MAGIREGGNIPPSRLSSSTSLSASHARQKIAVAEERNGDSQKPGSACRADPKEGSENVLSFDVARALLSQEEPNSIEQHTQVFQNLRTQATKRLVPQMIATPQLTQDWPAVSQSGGSKMWTKGASFNNLHHLLFNKLAVPAQAGSVLRKTTQLETRFWEPSKDSACRVPVEVVCESWKQASTAGHDTRRSKAKLTTTAVAEDKTIPLGTLMAALNHLTSLGDEASRDLCKVSSKLQMLWEEVSATITECVSIEAELLDMEKNVLLPEIQTCHTLTDLLLSTKLSDLCQAERSLYNTELKDDIAGFSAIESQRLFSALIGERENAQRSKYQHAQRRHQQLQAMLQARFLQTNQGHGPHNNIATPEDNKQWKLYDRYLLVRPIAEGQWSDVWEAVDTTTHQPVILTCHWIALSSQADARRLQKWIEHFQTLTKTSVASNADAVRMYDTSAADSIPCLSELDPSTGVATSNLALRNIQLKAQKLSPAWRILLPSIVSAPSLPRDAAYNNGNRPSLVTMSSCGTTDAPPSISPVSKETTPRLSRRSVSATGRSHEQMDDKTSTVIVPFLSSYPCEPSGFPLKNYLDEKGPLDLQTRRMYIWELCTFVQEWEKQQPVVVKVLPLTKSAVLLDGHRVQLYVGAHNLCLKQDGNDAEGTLPFWSPVFVSNRRQEYQSDPYQSLLRVSRSTRLKTTDTTREDGLFLPAFVTSRISRSCLLEWEREARNITKNCEKPLHGGQREDGNASDRAWFPMFQSRLHSYLIAKLLEDMAAPSLPEYSQSAVRETNSRHREMEAMERSWLDLALNRAAPPHVVPSIQRLLQHPFLATFHPETDMFPGVRAPIDTL